jgi:ABC-2 type transport system permease protein
MITNLKYELIKLFTIRSTYILTIFGLLLSGLIMSITVWKTKNLELLSATQPLQIMSDAPGLVALLCAVIAILVVGHEYRHNTIAYTLSASRSRASIMFSKAIVIAGFTLVFALLSIVVALICYEIAMFLRLDAFPSLKFDSDVWTAMFKNVMYAGGMALFAWLITTLVRSIVFAIVAFFMVPTIESMLTIVMKDNTVYLPATALDQVIVTSSDPIISPLKAAIVFLIYLVAGSIISYLLFLRRDAN